MIKTDLVKDLRKQFIDLDPSAKNMFQNLSEDKILDIIHTCNECKKKILDDDEVLLIVKLSKNVDDFLLRINDYLKAIKHNCGKTVVDQEFNLE